MAIAVTGFVLTWEGIYIFEVLSAAFDSTCGIDLVYCVLSIDGIPVRE
jgi:hypothetical protein